MPEIRVTAFLTISLADISKSRLFRQNDWYWAKDFKKKVSKKTVSFSKLGCFLMIPDESMKCPNLLKRPIFFENFCKIPPLKFIIFPKKPIFTNFCQKNCQESSDPDFRYLGLLWWRVKRNSFSFSSWKVKILCLYYIDDSNWHLP